MLLKPPPTPRPKGSPDMRSGGKSFEPFVPEVQEGQYSASPAPSRTSGASGGSKGWGGGLRCIVRMW